MAVKFVRFISLLLTALTAGLVFCHVLELPGKLALSAPVYLNVQQVLYTNWGGYVGAIEAGALLSSLLLLFLIRQRQMPFLLTAIAAVCLAAMILVWAIWIRPINNQINAWTLETMPTNWTQFRDHWEHLHSVRAILAVIGLSSLILAVIFDTPISTRAGTANLQNREAYYNRR